MSDACVQGTNDCILKSLKENRNKPFAERTVMNYGGKKY